MALIKTDLIGLALQNICRVNQVSDLLVLRIKILSIREMIFKSKIKDVKTLIILHLN